MKFSLALTLLLFTQVYAATVNEALQIGKQWKDKVFRSQVQATWLNDHDFWYRVQTGAQSYEYVQIRASDGTRKTALTRDGIGLPERERTKTSESKEKEHASKEGPAVEIVFLNRFKEDVKIVWIDTQGDHHDYKVLQAGDDFRQNTFSGHVWMFKDSTDKPLAVITAGSSPLEVEIDAISPVFQQVLEPRNKLQGVKSPNGIWQTYMNQGRLMLSNLQTGKIMQVNLNLVAESPVYGGITWAPDSSCFVVSCSAEIRRRQITIIESSPQDQVQPKRLEIEYPKPGDTLPQPWPILVRLNEGGCESMAVKSDLFPDQFIQKKQLDVRWSADSREFYFDYNERGHQRYCIIGVNAKTVKARVIVEETSRTFIDYTKKTWRYWLDKSGELLWMSERDGWCHLWLYDVKTGLIKQQITQGQWVVREVLHMDEDKRQIWFMASGLRKNEDPYHQHLCCVNLDGSGFRQLTQADGQHQIEWSPDHRYFIATWSRVDHPPMIELRRSEDGSLVCTLEKADASALLNTGWQLPERFVAKGRDGQTDIHGVLIKPSFFDPQKSYPVVEQVYAGPHSSFSPKDFNVLSRQHEMAELGFIVVQADGMGTNHRGKAYHDSCWKNLKDAGFPDRIRWIKSAAKSRPWMDLQRVGIYGGSAGGQSAMRALLDHHDFYKVAVADCGCHDNRMDKIWWNEQWMGWPVDKSYATNSNVNDAGKLQGALLLIVGELDTNVDPASTFQVVNALQKAGKSFDFMPIMGTGHGAAETQYGSRLRMEFLVKHLRP